MPGGITIRSLIERVTVHPREDGSFEIELEGELTRMIEVSLDTERGPKNKKTTLADAERRSVIVVAGARNHREFTVKCLI